MADQQVERFRIDPGVVFKLGQELISDETQALLELIKNAYDADASFAVVRIDTRGTPSDLLIECDPEKPGFIEVRDDGVGMTRNEIRDGWLLIARSLKAEFKATGRQTQKKRTPLGDKGLGRLGAQRLGFGLQLATKTGDNKNELVLAFSWRDFFSAKTLDEVNVRSKRRSTDRKQGTTVMVSELNDPERWRGEAITSLQRELSRVISPYEGVSGFKVTVSIDGTPLDLQSINRDVLDTAQLHYDITFDGNKLTMRGMATLGLFRPAGGAEREAFVEFVEADRGADFRRCLIDSAAGKDFNLKSRRGRWFIAFSRVRQLKDVVDPPPRSDIDEKPALPNPGPFHAKVDSFDLGSGEDERFEVFGGLKPYREFIRGLAGIRVYRDGFAVRVDRDWLGLSEQWTSARSYYGLKPDTTTGYVALSARDNPTLVEKTDREGFTDTEDYQALQSLMSEFRGFTEEVQAHLRREFVEYFKQKQEERAEVEQGTTAEGLSDSVDEALEEASDSRGKVEAAQESLDDASSAAEEALNMNDGTDPAERLATIEASARRLRDATEESQGVLREIGQVLGKLENARIRNELIRDEIGNLREQFAMGIEAMGLGLTAEALSHEMFNIADGLSSRTQEINRQLKDGKSDGREIRRYVEHVRGAIGALRTELGHFSPSMRFVRQRREVLDMPTVASDLQKYYGKRWRDNGITVWVKDSSKSEFKLRVNRGRINQVFDNLILNSHYWLEAAIRRGELKRGTISIRLRSPIVIVSDNGPGIDPSVEGTLFEPFTTRKPRGKGRGLGLFIVRQLMEGDGCSVELGPRRNAEGHRYEFHLDFSGALDEG